MRKLLFLIFLLAPAIGSALTLSQIETQIRLRIKDSDSARQRYTDDQLDSMINQTQRDIVNVSWILKSNTEIALSTGTTYYSFPGSVIAIDRITLGYRNLPETTLQKLDSDFDGSAWALQNGMPTQYFQDPSRPGQIGLFPWPQAIGSTGTIRMIYYSQSTDMSSDSDEPFDGDNRYAPYQDLLIYEPCYKIFVIEGDAARANDYRAYYESRLQILMEKVGNRPNYLPGFSAQRK